MKPELIYYTKVYQDFLKELLLAADESISVLRSTHQSTCLPLLVKDGPLGRIANSLPFYGSHGGPHSMTGEPYERVDALRVLEERIDNGDYSSVTVIENPFDCLSKEEVAVLKNLEVVDTRISQVTQWDEDIKPTESLLLEKFHPKTRNAVRKGLIRIGEVKNCTHDKEVFDFLVTEHQKSIALLGGIPKSSDVFVLLQKHLNHYLRVYGAFSREGDLGAALLTLEYCNTIEYFTPVVHPNFRESQMLSGLIFNVMQNRFQNGFTAWNWGGTWQSQVGVHLFKSRFGSTNRVYRYLNWCDAKVKKSTPENLLEHYPYWYTRNFSS
jgi:hypothetical protein